MTDRITANMVYSAYLSFKQDAELLGIDTTDWRLHPGSVMNSQSWRITKNGRDFLRLGDSGSLGWSTREARQTLRGLTAGLTLGSTTNRT